MDSLREMHRHSPEHVPEVYLHDETMSLVAMQYLAPPHVIMRHGILSGYVYSQVAAQLADLLACTLFRTSLLAMPADTFREKAAMYVNGEMCELTEQVRPRSVSTRGCGSVLCVGVTIVVSLAMSTACTASMHSLLRGRHTEQHSDASQHSTALK